MKLLIATTNEGKKKELLEALEEIALLSAHEKNSTMFWFGTHVRSRLYDVIEHFYGPASGY